MRVLANLYADILKSEIPLSHTISGARFWISLWIETGDISSQSMYR